MFPTPADRIRGEPNGDAAFEPPELAGIKQVKPSCAGRRGARIVMGGIQQAR